MVKPLPLTNELSQRAWEDHENLESVKRTSFHEYYNLHATAIGCWIMMLLFRVDSTSKSETLCWQKRIAGVYTSWVTGGLGNCVKGGLADRLRFHYHFQVEF